MIRKPAAIIDLDNCISNDEWRMKLIRDEGVHPWERFYDYHQACYLDEYQNGDVVTNLQRNHTLIVFTARPELVRRDTVVWLRQNRIPVEVLLMRPNDCHTTSVALKEHMLLSLDQSVYDVRVAIDDRTDVLGMYADNGVPQCRRVFIHNVEVIPMEPAA